MAFTDVIENTRAVLIADGFEENGTRNTLAAETDGGKDRRFTVAAGPVTETFFEHAIPRNVRTALLRVQLGFYAGGGDAGGADHGGDMVNVNARAYDASARVAGLLENQLNYDAQNTGIRRTNLRGWDRVSTARRSEVWEVQLAVEWEEPQKAAAVPA